MGWRTWLGSWRSGSSKDLAALAAAGRTPRQEASAPATPQQVQHLPAGLARAVHVSSAMLVRSITARPGMAQQD